LQFHGIAISDVLMLFCPLGYWTIEYYVE